MYSTHKIADYKIYGLEICIPPFNSYAIRSILVPYALQSTKNNIVGTVFIIIKNHWKLYTKEGFWY
jgi:hypothetical protein